MLFKFNTKIIRIKNKFYIFCLDYYGPMFFSKQKTNRKILFNYNLGPLQVNVIYHLLLINGDSKLHASWLLLTLKNKIIASYYTIYNKDESMKNELKVKYLKVKISLLYKKYL
jgi:hypothetical protein